MVWCLDQNTLQLIPVCMSEPLGKLVTHTLVHVCYMYYIYYMYVCVCAFPHSLKFSR